MCYISKKDYYAEEVNIPPMPERVQSKTIPHRTVEEEYRLLGKS